MQYLGFALVGVAVIALIVAFMQRRKGKKILATPFRKTGEVTAVGSGLVSCEGKASTPQPLTAPCTGTPCLYYEVLAEQKWEEQVATENGTKTKSGKNTIENKKVGLVFSVDDGSGTAQVDATESVDADLKKTFSESKKMGTGTAVFGNYSVMVNAIPGNKYSVGVVVTEKIIPIDQNLFVLGELAEARIKKPKGMLGSLMVSTKGRDGLLGSTKRNSIMAFAAAGIMVLPGGYFSIFGEPPVDHCANMVDDPQELCTDRIYGDAGNTYEWRVTAPGQYEVRVDTPSVATPLIPVLSITDANGNELNPGQGRLARTEFAPGTYRVRVRDQIQGDPSRFEGGFSFSLAIDRQGTLAEAATPPSPAPAATN